MDHLLRPATFHGCTLLKYRYLRQMLTPQNGSECSWRLLVLFMLIDIQGVRISVYFVLVKMIEWLDTPYSLLSLDGLLVIASLPSVKQPDT